MSLRLLAFDLDDGVLNGRTIGTTERQLEYVEHMDGMSVIIHSPGYSASTSIKISDRLTYHISSASNRLGFWADGYRIGKQICTNSGITLVLAQEPFLTGLIGSLLKRRFGLPLIVDLHAEFFSSRSGWVQLKPRNRVLRPLGLWVLRRADGIRSVSRSITETIIKMGIDRDRILTLRMPLNASVVAHAHAVDPPCAAPLQTVESEATRLLFVGRLVAQKNIPVLLRAVSELSLVGHKIILTLVGEGRERPRLQELAERMGILPLVRFEGWQSPEVVSNYYRNADLFVLCSTFEGLPKVLAEAIIHGLPAVATDTDGCSEVIHHGETGLLVSPDDPSALVRALRYLIENPNERLRLAKNARRMGQELLDREAIIRRTVEFWRSIAQQNTSNVRNRRSL